MTPDPTKDKSEQGNPEAGNSFAARLAMRLEMLSEWSGRIAAWLILGIILLSVFSIITDNFFASTKFTRNFSIILSNLTLYLFGVMFMMGIAYTLKHDNHVRVDIFYRDMSPRKKALVNLVGTIIFLVPMCLVLLYYSTPEVINSWLNERGSIESGGLGYIYVIKSFMLVMPVLLLLQGIANIILLIRYLTGAGSLPGFLQKKAPSEEEQI